MNYYPVIIPTLCRYEHLKRCVESLSRCTYADQTELIISLDYPSKEEHWQGYNQICEYLPQITGLFKKVTVLKQKKNLGAIENVKYINRYAFQYYGALIFSEDDNEFSPCFLDFMDAMLDKYWDNLFVTSISGYVQTSYYNLTDKNIFCVPEVSAWGIGIWKHKEKERINASYSKYEDILHSLSSSWKLFSRYPACLLMFMCMVRNKAVYGDAIRTFNNILNNTIQLRPSISMVRNWGNDGTGLHCVADTSFISQYIVENKFFMADSIGTFITKVNKKVADAMFYMNLPKSRLKAWILIVKIGILYLCYRMSVLKRK